MAAIRLIKGTDYFCVTRPGRDDWIMRPQTGRSWASHYGISPSGTVWFFSTSCGFLFYDTQRESLVSRLQTPPATDGEGEATRDSFHYFAIPSPDGRYVYLLIQHGAGTKDLQVVSIDEQTLVANYIDLPGGGLLREAVLDLEGHLLMPSQIRTDDRASPGLVRLDPETGEFETSVCDNSPVRGWLHSASPGSRYWLRTDDSRLPMTEASPGFIQTYGQTRVLADHFFGLCHEIWEAFPLRRLHSVTSMWLSTDEMPDEGFYDSQTRKDNRPAKRGHIYRELSQLLAQDNSLNLSTLWRPNDACREVWPDKDFFERQVSRNARKIGFRTEEIAARQPDGEAYWMQRGGFVSCVGVGGTVSPKIMLERFGYSTGSWLPTTERALRVQPLPGRRADMFYLEGTATVSGHAEPATPNIRVVPVSEDNWRENRPDADTRRDAKLAERADKLAKRLSKYVATLTSLAEADCIKAIEEITAQIGPETEQHAYDSQLQAVFKLEGKRLDEKKFFAHVLKNFPGAVPALRRLIDTYCDNLHPSAALYWKPTDGIGAFAHAALCLAKLDPSSIATLRRYAETIDTYHEYFFMEKTLPVMWKHLGASTEMLDLAEWLFFTKLGNCANPSSFWRKSGMQKTAKKLFSPEAYALRLRQRSKEWPFRTKAEVTYGHLLLDRLREELNDELTAWERALFVALSTETE